MKKSLLGLAAALLLLPAAFGQIVPVSATGSGVFNNNPSLLIDGVIPAEQTSWQDAKNVWWYGETPAFTIDLGGFYNLTGVKWSVDNNDSYALQYSADNVIFTTLFTVQVADGNIDPNPGGMDTMTSYPGADFVANMAFSPVEARYLRAFAVGGDGLYAIGEIQSFSEKAGEQGAVPEPSTYGVIGAASLAALVLIRRRFRA